MQEDKCRDTETTTWIDKHVPMSPSLSSNLIEQPIFLRNSSPRALVESFVDALDGLATQSKAQMKLKLLKIETSAKTKLIEFSLAPNQRRHRNESQLELEDDCNKE